MKPLDDVAHPKDGTLWKGKPVFTRSHAIHPWPDHLYYGRGKDTVEGWRWFQPDGINEMICLPEHALEHFVPDSNVIY